MDGISFTVHTRTGNQIPSSPESGSADCRSACPATGIACSRTHPAGTACRCVVMGVPACSLGPYRRLALCGTLELGDGGCTGGWCYIFDESAG